MSPKVISVVGVNKHTGNNIYGAAFVNNKKDATYNSFMDKHTSFLYNIEEQCIINKPQRIVLKQTIDFENAAKNHYMLLTLFNKKYWLINTLTHNGKSLFYPSMDLKANTNVENYNLMMQIINTFCVREGLNYYDRSYLVPYVAHVQDTDLVFKGLSLEILERLFKNLADKEAHLNGCSNTMELNKASFDNLYILGIPLLKKMYEMAYFNYSAGLIGEKAWNEFLIEYNKLLNNYNDHISSLKKEYPMPEE